MMQNHYNYEQMLKGMAPLYCNIIFVTPMIYPLPSQKKKKERKKCLVIQA